MTFNGGMYKGGDWEEGFAVTINTTMKEANFSNKLMGSSEAQILAAFIGRKFFQDNGALSKLDISANNSIPQKERRHLKKICNAKGTRIIGYDSR